MDSIIRYSKKYGILIAGPLLVLGLSVWPLTDNRQDTICMMRRLFAIPCPTCGMTRSLANLVKGNIGRSLQYHPYGILTAAFLLLVWAVVSWHNLRQTPLHPLMIKAFFAILVLLACLFLATWIFTVLLPLIKPT